MAPSAKARLPRLGRPGAVDAALALLFAAAALVELALSDVRAPLEAKAASALLTTLPLAWRSLAPVATAAVTAGSYAVAVFVGLPSDATLIPVAGPIVALYSVGARAGARGVGAAAAAALVPYAAAIATAGEEGTEFWYYAIGVLGALVVGRAVRAMGFESDVLAARASELELRSEERARAAVEAERARIARELHDVIGHSISVMGVQTGAVRRLLAPEQEREREVLLAVERTGRDAVAEMRRLLGFLRSTEDGAAFEALPTVQRVDDLVAELRRAGLEVELRVEGDFEDVAPGRALAVFRILQEALTNAVKHAPAAPVHATLRRTPVDVVVEVVSAGSAGPSARADGGGHGLVGMRERAALYGGTLEAGPDDGRGFVVSARIPTGGS